MQTVKYVCKHCNKAEKYSKKQLLVKGITRTVISLLSFMGLLFIAYILIVGITPVGTALSGATFTIGTMKHHDEVRFLAVNITEDCNGGDEYCLTRELFTNMSGIRYIPDSALKQKTYNPIYVYNNGDDCEGLAQMFVSFAQTVGVDAKVECSINHCVARVTLKQHNIIIDLTSPIAYQVNDTEHFSDITMDEKNERRVWN